MISAGEPLDVHGDGASTRDYTCVEDAADALLGVAAQVVVMGLLADLIAANRKLVEDVLVRVERIESGVAAAREPRGENGEPGS